MIFDRILFQWIPEYQDDMTTAANDSTVTFNTEFLRKSARELARRQSTKIGDRNLIPVRPILTDSKKILNDAYRLLAKLAKSGQDLSPASEWLIDNFYIIQEQVIQVASDFPIEYQKSIPNLSTGDYKGFPRVYELILNLLTHTDNRFEDDTLTRYIHSFQEEETLMLGEVWAIPIMIRFILVRQLAEKAEKIIKRKQLSGKVERLISRILDSDTREPGAVNHLLSQWMQTAPGRDPLILTEMIHQTQAAGLLQEEQKQWFRYRFNQYDLTIEEALRIDLQKQSRLQVSIQNAVISLRDVSETDWSELVEEWSVVNQMLKLDPHGTYTEMDFQTRDSYRRVIERLSRRSGYSETEVVETVLVLAEDHIQDYEKQWNDYLHDRSPVRQHVGYWLTGEGYPELVKECGYSMPFRERIHRILEKQAGYYLSLIGLHTLALLGILWWVTGAGGYSALVYVSLVMVALFPAIDLSVAAVNRFFAFFLPPRILPKMSYKEGIPDHARTLVVVPTLVNSPADVRHQLEILEIRSLANPDSKLQFALLTDFTDAPTQKTEGDEAILEAARTTVAELNHKYSSDYGEKFFLLHRQRLWNEKEGVWMGWERKRGKLEELNLLLTHPSSETSYNFITEGFIESIRSAPVQFVITLDADTKLPPDSAIDLVRTAAHPLNRAWYDPEKKRITKGYAILQPRISISPESAQKSFFSRIFSGNVGVDPYSTAVSDIYQDLMGEAVFTGKGIYDVEAFHKVLYSQFPENRILSHDLIESSYLRTGLATDMELYDDYPATYNGFSRRNHRWTRGDWQIASWLLPNVPGKDGKHKNPLNLLSKWKIFDNLRRSLNPFFLTLFFLAGWFWLPGSAWIWTIAAFGILAFPIYVSLSTDIMNRPARVRWKLYLNKVRSNLRVNTLQSLSTLIFLPHQAVLQLDAIFRTLWRLVVSKKNLLEWTTAFQTENLSPGSVSTYLRSMVMAILLGLFILLVTLFIEPSLLWVTLPFFILWAGSPIYAWYVSRPVSKKREPFSKADKWKLRTYARRTWFYFERFVTEEHSWFPPDNFQEDPPLVPVARTSPTNIGLTLVSTQVAYRMGYITFGELLERLERTLLSLDQLERYNGHFYNWYDTKLGKVLNPIYISTVDSGNLAAGLIVVKEAVKQEMTKRSMNRYLWSGLQDTVRTVHEIFCELRDERKVPEEMFNRFCVLTRTMQDKLEGDCPKQSSACLELLRSLKMDALRLSGIDLFPLRNELGDEKLNDLLFWLESPLKQIESFINEIRALEIPDETDDTMNSLLELIEGLATRNPESKTLQFLKRRKSQAENIISICNRLVSEMDFSFLYNKKRKLFVVGFNTEKSQADKSTYDLLASEARIASYIAIAKGDVPSEHWFRLSRRLTSLNKNEILLSWGGTMFEYLMPLLFMHSYPNTLLSHTYNNVIRWQRDYGKKRGHPWGFSESAYYFLNLEMHYQYRAFGAPGLGMKRGLAEEYVIAPYASMLALMVDPESAIENLREIEQAGGLGLHGFYDAIDYTPTRQSESETYKVVKTYMAHHHGMSLLALENILNGWSIHHYFHSDPAIRGCDLLLQERVPRGVPIKEPHPIDAELEPGEQKMRKLVVEHAGIDVLDATPPRVHILSSGDYSVFVSHTGTGYSQYGNQVLTSWKPDTIMDNDGFFFYVRDLENGSFWSASHQPVKKKPDRYDTWFHNGKVITSRVDDWIETTTEICVSPDQPIELRRLTLTNYSNRKRKLELTSYVEGVLNQPEDHHSHPAFSKLFLQTDYIARHHALLVKRRPRSEEAPAWLVHTFAGPDSENLTEPLQFETERSEFIGRGRSTAHPTAMDKGKRLSGSFGNVTDPIVSLRKEISLRPGEKVQITFGLGWAASEEEAIQMADTYENPHATDRVFDLASVYGNVELEHTGINSNDAHYFCNLASWILYSDSKFRADVDTLKKNRKGQKGLWAYGISGDMPLVVFRIDDTDQLKSVRRLIKAHSYWKLKGLNVELLILNDHPPGYVDEVEKSIQQEIQKIDGGRDMNTRGGIYIQRTERMPEEDVILILSVAHTVFEKKLPVLDGIRDVVETSSWQNENLPDLLSQKSARKEFEQDQSEREGALRMFNGFGGFSKEGDEYHILIRRDPETGRHKFPPNPWVNVISNPSFGFLVTDRGAGYTWSENSRENKLTGWSNDPVCDPFSEAFYLRDEDRKVYWSPIPGPIPGKGDYRTVHGFGYTRHKHSSLGLEQMLTRFVPRTDPVGISWLTIKNNGSESRKLSLFRYQEWVMGVDRNRSARFVITEHDESDGVVYARNFYNNEFSERVGFAALIAVDQEYQTSSSFTTSRATFVGRNRTLECPLALENSDGLDGRTIIGGDPCAAFQEGFELPPGEEASFIILAGEAGNRTEAESIIRTWSDDNAVEDELEAVKNSWSRKLGRIRVDVPDESMNLLMNGWLMYQNISSRLWARTGFYQAGGAYGYRDQLQDAMAVVYADPEMARSQIKLHASQQFREGDVLHWWHPPAGSGIRSRISDDRLWLPYVTAFYIRSVGDDSILDEKVPWITARMLEPGEQEAYLSPKPTQEQATIYEHCCRAIDISLKFGIHGLPLIGSGDWNDGMNRIGKDGKGESVWLGFFIYSILQNFEKICRQRDEPERADRYRETASDLKKRLNREGWDGNWYLRAFYDDGTPLGSSDNNECRIDALSQSWSVITGVASKSRGEKVLAAVENFLISEQEGIIRLLTPPFDKTEKNPGYIKGYIPGVRENGGQYTHAALWTVKAFAEAGMGDKAVRFFDMINPVNHASDEQSATVYKVEPYVVAADIYGEMPLTGQGGWTWYTGSAGWMYRVALESILGLQLEKGYLRMKPSISSGWNEYSIRMVLDDEKTVYEVSVVNPAGLEGGPLEGSVDGKPVRFEKKEARIRLERDGNHHRVQLKIRKSSLEGGE